MDERTAKKKIISGSNYYFLPHLSEYKILLENNHDTGCDAEVWIDGEKVGSKKYMCLRANTYIFGSFTVPGTVKFSI